MSLDNFYSLRNNFLVIGLTGRTGGGCNDVCEFLKSEHNPFTFQVPNNLHINEIQKFNICKNILTNSNNPWTRFTVVKYRDILLLFFLSKIYSESSKDYANLSYHILLENFKQLYDKDTVTRRIGQKDNIDNVVKKTHAFCQQKIKLLSTFIDLFGILQETLTITKVTEDEQEEHFKYLNKLYFEEYAGFAKQFFKLIDDCDPISRQLFLQDIACNLRSSEKIYSIDKPNANFIFTVAIAIKNIIKLNRKATGANRIVIDSLKNSLEINYFRERYAGFYLIASSRDEYQVNEYIESKVIKLGLPYDRNQKIISAIKNIDKVHYKTSDFKKGKFTTPDIENCIQKADYYVYLGKNQKPEPDEYEPGHFRYYSLELQLLKFLALIYKPGIVTPSAIERSMQLAFSSKYNSGCISRQVGAVVTDVNYSVKSIGWNEVPQGQTPCSLRSLKELVEGERPNVYSAYEKNGGDYSGKTFKEKVNDTLMEVYGEEKEFFNNLEGHNCPYCFKDFHNSFEGKDNQVHTRSLHAEENAMLQISKYGGQPLQGGILFTTASPCELCSKKAFQLGISKVFYIDPYPGIAKEQILKAGNDIEKNPDLFMFQGAVGRGYFKLYEPYMSVKDETSIRTRIKPKISEDKIFENMKAQLVSKFPNSEILKNADTYDTLLGLIETGLGEK